MTPDIIAALRKCRDQFEFYAQEHRIKVDAAVTALDDAKYWGNVDEQDKTRKELERRRKQTATNEEMVALCDAALSTSPAGQEVRAWEYERDQRLVQCHRAERGEHPYWIERPLSYATHPAPALDGVSEAYRRGIYDAKCWLRDQQHKNPPDSLWHAAAILADRMDVALLSSPSEGESATVSREPMPDTRTVCEQCGKLGAFFCDHVATPATSTERGR